MTRKPIDESPTFYMFKDGGAVDQRALKQLIGYSRRTMMEYRDQTAVSVGSLSQYTEALEALNDATSHLTQAFKCLAVALEDLEGLDND